MRSGEVMMAVASADDAVAQAGLSKYAPVTRPTTAPSDMLARLDSAPFTDRLVRKFRLPVTGWRGK